jgi:phosphohistidine phosphatase
MRPLALQGRRQAVAAGSLLAESRINPDRALVSGALRTRQTWELVSNSLDIDVSFAEISDELYLAHPQDVLNRIVEHDSEECVLVIGHEPTMSALAAHLAGEGSNPDVYEKVRFGLRTCAFAVLECELPWDQWGQGAARLVFVGRPEV